MSITKEQTTGPTKKSNLVNSILLAMISTFSLTSCTDQAPQQASKDSITKEERSHSVTNELSVTSVAMLEHLSDKVSKHCNKSSEITLAIDKFIATPIDETLDRAKQQWKSHHQSFLALKVLQYLPIEHPILDHLPISVASQSDNESATKTVEHSIWQRLDQAPLFGGYLDYVQQYPYSGIVNADMTISSEFLLKEFQFSDDMYVTLGQHAIEFMIWGESGERPAEDYQANKDVNSSANHRRAALLSTINRQHQQDTQRLCETLQEQPSLYASKLRQYAENQQIEIWLQAVKSLIERNIIPALARDNALSFHSPYSHNDIADIKTLSYNIREILTLTPLIDALNKLAPEENKDQLKNRIVTLEKTINSFTKNADNLKDSTRAQSDAQLIAKANEQASNLAVQLRQIIDEI